MPSYVSLSDLRQRGVPLRPHEAVAIAQTLIQSPEISAAVAGPPFGPPIPETVEVGSNGAVVCTSSAATPAVSEVGVLLQALLPPGETRIPGGLRYAIGRALLEVEGPPFDTIEDFSRALARFEQGDRGEVVRTLVERAASETSPRRPFAWPSAALAQAPVAPFIGDAGATRTVERRSAGPGVDELRR